MKVLGKRSQNNMTTMKNYNQEQETKGNKPPKSCYNSFLLQLSAISNHERPLGSARQATDLINGLHSFHPLWKRNDLLPNFLFM